MKGSRRKFIKQMGYVGIGFSMLPVSGISESRFAGSTGNGLAVLPDDDQISAWLQVLENGKIRVLTGKMELGQGIGIAIMQVAAEELNTDPDRIEINLAETGVTPDEGYTAGSRSIESSAMSVRKAAASARELILKMASLKWQTDPKDIALENGFVSTKNKKISFYELFDGQQIEEKINPSVVSNGKSVKKWVGRPVPRQDIAAMVKGYPVYVQDLRFPGMVHARVVRPESYTSELESLDVSDLKEHPGFLKLVRIGSFLGVIAEGEYQAIQLREKVSDLARWKSETKLPAKTPLKKHLKSLPVATEEDENKGDWKAAMANANIRHSASYFKPYVMHAANGPSCAVALYDENKLTVWSHTQGVYPLRKTLSALLELPETDIHVKGVPGSGCYGHNGADDVAAEAALMAVDYPGKHIRLQWMRDDEHGWEPYGTAMMMELRAGLDDSGKIQGWKYDVWSDGHSTRPDGDAGSLLPARYLGRGHQAPGTGYRGGAIRNSLPYYSIENLNSTSHIFQGPLRKSALRGLGAYANIFAIECFMDELAEKANIEPVQFRLMHLEDERALECLDRLQKNTSEVALKNNEGMGYAFARYKNTASYCAISARVHVNPADGKVQVQKMWAVIDSGETINPDGLKNQTEGGMIQSASWALKEEVRFDENHITSLDWDSYPIFRFPDVPETEVEVIDRIDQAPLGAGEAAQGPATAAVVNAIYNASGIRIRDLPVDPDRLIKT